MLSEILTYFSLGIEHILSIYAWDHILFLSVLGVFYPQHQWKKILYLITAFTLGHFISLILIFYFIDYISPAFVETLIPITIIISAIGCLLKQSHTETNISFKWQFLEYGLIFIFGLIHGSAFGQSLFNLIDQVSSLVIPVLCFNLGVEIGQIIYLSFFLFFRYKIVPLLKLHQLTFKKWICLLAIILSIFLLLQRLHYI